MQRFYRARLRRRILGLQQDPLQPGRPYQPAVLLLLGLCGGGLVQDLLSPLSAWIEKLPIRLGTVITWCLVVFMCVNMAVSSAALARYTARIEGQPPRNQIEEYLDEHFDDARMKQIYPSSYIPADRTVI